MKKGFTLAEVLITLTIIGVIAALTIPNLMQSYRKHQVEVGLKSFYSILNNAVNVAKANSGLSITEMMETAYNTSSNHNVRTNFFVDNYLLPNLKTQKTCSYPGSMGSDDCDIVPFEQFTDYSGNTSTDLSVTGSRAFYRILLSNGMYMGIALSMVSSGYLRARIYVDINGKKGANQLGKDIFAFVILPDLSGVCEGEDTRTCIPNEGVFAGLLYPTFYNRLSDCVREVSTCAAYIQKSGWKIPDDYPVKKF